MRPALRSIAAFNTATAVWLTAMFLILKHSGYAANAVETLGIAGFCVLVFASARAHAALWLRGAALVGSVMLAAYGARAIYIDLRLSANFEGFILVVGAGWVIQGVLALAVAYASAGAAPAVGPRA